MFGVTRSYLLPLSAGTDTIGTLTTAMGGE